MLITCPECQFSREVADDKIPAGSVNATCPQCGARFRFRSPNGHDPAEEAQADDHAQAAMADTGQSSDPTTRPAAGTTPEAASAAPAHDDAPPQSAETDAPQGKPSEIWQRLDDLGKSTPERTPERGSYSFSDAPNARETVDVPFEDLERFGFFGGMWETIKRAMFHPGLFFGAMPLGRSRTRALIFYILIGELSYLALTIWDAAGIDPMSLLMENGGGTQSDAGFYATLAGQLGFMIVLPVFYVAYLYFSAGIMHMMLKLYGGADEGFEATLKVACYSSAPSVLFVLPIVGVPIGSLWQLYSFFVGLKNVHRSSYAKLFMAFTTLVLGVTVLITFLVRYAPQVPSGAM